MAPLLRTPPMTGDDWISLGAFFFSLTAVCILSLLVAAVFTPLFTQKFLGPQPCVCTNLPMPAENPHVP